MTGGLNFRIVIRIWLIPIIQYIVIFSWKLQIPLISNFYLLLYKFLLNTLIILTTPIQLLTLCFFKPTYWRLTIILFYQIYKVFQIMLLYLLISLSLRSLFKINNKQLLRISKRKRILSMKFKNAISNINTSEIFNRKSLEEVV